MIRPCMWAGAGRPADMPMQPAIDAAVAALGGSSALQPLQPFEVRSVPFRAYAARLPDR